MRELHCSNVLGSGCDPQVAANLTSLFSLQHCNHHSPALTSNLCCSESLGLLLTSYLELLLMSSWGSLLSFPLVCFIGEYCSKAIQLREALKLFWKFCHLLPGRQIAVSTCVHTHAQPGTNHPCSVWCHTHALSSSQPTQHPAAYVPRDTGSLEEQMLAYFS